MYWYILNLFPFHTFETVAHKASPITLFWILLEFDSKDLKKKIDKNKSGSVFQFTDVSFCRIKQEH